MDRRPLLLITTLLVALLGSSGLQAQSHPCDTAAPATTTILSGAPHRVQFCARASDNVEAALVRVDATPFDLVAVTAQTGASATGQILYQTGQFLQVPRGTHSMTVALYNRNAVTGQMQLGAESSPPFTFAAVDDTPLPAPATIKGIVR